MESSRFLNLAPHLPMDLGKSLTTFMQIQGLEEMTSQATCPQRRCCLRWSHTSSPHILQLPATTLNSIWPDQELSWGRVEQVAWVSASQ